MFCFRNTETFCYNLKCFAFSFQNSIFYLKINLFLDGERKKKEDIAQTGCRAQNEITCSEQNKIFGFSWK